MNLRGLILGLPTLTPEVTGASVPVNQVRPSLSAASFQEGVEIALDLGVWSGADVLTGTLKYGSDGTVVGVFPFNTTYTPTSDDVGEVLILSVVGANGAGSSLPAESEPTSAILPAVPVFTVNPTISTPIPQEGVEFTVTVGIAPSADSYAAELRYADDETVIGTFATDGLYTPDSSNVGHALYVVSIATNAGGDSLPAESSVTDDVLPALPVNTAVPTITGTAQVGETLTAHAGTWTGTPVLTYTWEADGTPIAGETDTTLLPTVAEVGAAITRTEHDSVSGTSATSAATSAVSVITAGAITPDPVTLHSLGFTWTMTGDLARQVTCEVDYRAGGVGAWLPAPDAFRSQGDRAYYLQSPPGYTTPNRFVGSVFNLTENTSYEVRASLYYPGIALPLTEETFTATTKKTPVLAAPTTTRHYYPADNAEEQTSPAYTNLQTALTALQPGEELVLHDGHPTYTSFGWAIENKAGTESAPLLIRGADKAACIFDLGWSPPPAAEVSTAGYGFTLKNCQYVIVQDMTMINGRQGVSLHETGSSNCMIANIDSPNIDRFVRDESSGTHHNLIIKDCAVIGVNATAFPRADYYPTYINRTGIKLYGNGHDVFNNTLSYFVDGIDILAPLAPTSTPLAKKTYAVDVYDNFIHHCADDIIEVDASEWNIRFMRNRCHTSTSGFSAQPSYGGPVYAIQNQFYNIADEALKANNEPSGVVWWNNTVGCQQPIKNDQKQKTNSHFLNNVYVNNDGTGNVCFETGAADTITSYDYEAARIGVDDSAVALGVGYQIYGYDGVRLHQYNAADLPGLYAAAGVHQHSVTLADDYAHIFHATYVPPDGTEVLTMPDFTPAIDSAALGAGIHIPTITTERGTGRCDMGAVELPAPAITTTSPLPELEYGAAPSAIAFTGVATLAITAGALPAGLTLNANGTWTGTATALGAFSFTITATNPTGTHAVAFTLAVSQQTFTQSLAGELLANPDFATWSGSPSLPTSWSLSGTGDDPGVRQVGAGEGHGGVGTGKANLYSSATNSRPQLSQSSKMTAGLYYENGLTVDTKVAGGIDLVNIAPGRGQSGSNLPTARVLGIGKATSTAWMLQGRTAPNDVTVDDCTLKLLTPNAVKTGHADGTHTVTFTLPGSPIARQQVVLRYRIADAANPDQDCWEAILTRNDANTAWLASLDRYTTGTRTNVIAAQTVTGTPDALRVVTSGNNHSLYTGISGTFTQQDITKSSAVNASAVSVQALYSSDVTPGKLTSV